MSQTIYTKTQLGTQALAGDRSAMSVGARKLLILIDGQRSLADLATLTGTDTMRRSLPELLNKGYIASLGGRSTGSAFEAGAGAGSALGASPGTLQRLAPDNITTAPFPHTLGQAPKPTAATSAPVPIRRGLVLVGWTLGLGGAALAAYEGLSTAPSNAVKANAETVAPALPPPPAALAPAEPPAVSTALVAAPPLAPPPTKLPEAPAAIVAPPTPVQQAGKRERVSVAAQATPAPRVGDVALVSRSPNGASLAAVPTLPPPAGRDIPAVNPLPAAKPALQPAPPAAQAAPFLAQAVSNASAAHPERAATLSPAHEVQLPIAAAPAPVAPPAPVRAASPPLLASIAKTPPAEKPVADPSPPVALHIRRQFSPETPERAVRAGVRSGRLVARLDVNADGKVSGVSLIQVSAPELFDDTVVSTLRRWTFDPPGRSAQIKVVINFDD